MVTVSNIIKVKYLFSWCEGLGYQPWIGKYDQNHEFNYYYFNFIYLLLAWNTLN